MLRVEVLPVTRMSSSELLDEGIRLEMALTPLGLCRSWKDPYARPARDLAGADGSKPQLLVAHPRVDWRTPRPLRRAGLPHAA